MVDDKGSGLNAKVIDALTKAFQPCLSSIKIELDNKSIEYISPKAD